MGSGKQSRPLLYWGQQNTNNKSPDLFGRLSLTALELNRVIEQLAAAERLGASAEERKKLEDQAVEKILEVILKVRLLSIVSPPVLTNYLPIPRQ